MVIVLLALPLKPIALFSCSEQNQLVEKFAHHPECTYFIIIACMSVPLDQKLCSLYKGS